MSHDLRYAQILDGTLKSLINEQGGYVVFLVLSEYSFIRDFRVLEVMRQNIATWCQQTFCIQKFVDNPQLCFAFTPKANFPAHNLNFH